jgi:hypothetical protein
MKHNKMLKKCFFGKCHKLSVSITAREKAANPVSMEKKGRI